MQHLSEYTLDSKPPLFSSDDFQDTSAFREWLLDKTGSEQSGNDEFQLVYSIVQQMSQLRFEAERYYQNHHYLSKDKHKELPLPVKKVLEIITQNINTHPPETVISRIAQDKIHFIMAVTEKIRKILRRERELTPIANVQQIDSRCLSWLTRQPGYTPAQKAGIKQKILSVVRRESFDTLENRVLKAFLELCVSYGQRYLSEFQSRFPKDESRIMAVKKLRNVAQQTLQSEEFISVRSLRGMPTPNYVLLHDGLYSIIWQMYLDLIHQTVLMENAWRNRPMLLQQYCIFHLFLAIRWEYNHSLFQSSLWFASGIQRNELFIRKSSFYDVFIREGKIWQFDYSEKKKTRGHYAEIISGDKKIKLPVSIGFLPHKYWNDEFVLPENENCFYWFFGAPSNPKLPRNIRCFTHESDIFDMMLSGVQQMFGDQK